MRNARIVPSRAVRRVPNGVRVPTRQDSEPKGARREGLVRCVFSECELGCIEECTGTGSNQLAVVRFTPGMVLELKSGPFFKENLRFPDGDKHKYAHSICAWDAGLRMQELSMEMCCLAGCGLNFMCSRHSEDEDSEGIYRPGKMPEWGCEPEGCLHIERGHVDWAKGGRFLKFTQDARGAVHWACAKGIWKWELFEGMTSSFASELVYAASQ